jgi:uncharacterized protein YndB with AHSA1/START domain
MIRDSASVLIRRPVEEVFRFAADPSNIPKWVKGAQVQQLSKGPFGEGTRFEQTTVRFGRTITFVVEVRNFRPNQGLDTYTITPPFPVRSSLGSLRFEATPDGTQFTLSHEIGIVLWLRPLELFLQRKVQKEGRRAVMELKRLLEQ